jgi:hypothetical protein
LFQFVTKAEEAHERDDGHRERHGDAPETPELVGPSARAASSRSCEMLVEK